MKDSPLKYFAYGSNKSLARLQQRVPSAEFLGLYSLKSHQLTFHNEGVDGSGKCDAFETSNENDIVYGALFNMHIKDKPTLDKAEDLGTRYNIKTVTVYREDESLEHLPQKEEAFMYYGLCLEPSLKPFSWYLNHVVTGAKEINSPSDYLALLEAIETTEDPNTERHHKEFAIHRK